MSANGENWEASGTSAGSADWESAAWWGEPAAEVPNRLTILALVLVGALMILLDATIVNVAVPTIQRSLHTSYSAIEWVVSGYALFYGLLPIPAGRLGDRIGHKKVYLIGLAGFTATSVLCGTSATAQELVAWRIAQGAMAGVMNPPVLAVIQAVFPARERGRAFGWAPWTFACIASALPVLAVFVFWGHSVSRRGGVPLVNLALYASRSFAAGSALSLVYFAGFIGLLFVLSLYLQIGLG
jgi:MFS family permease